MAMRAAVAIMASPKKIHVVTFLDQCKLLHYDRAETYLESKYRDRSLVNHDDWEVYKCAEYILP